jgi:D-threo-aldose 1-dehydrogenase
LYGYGLSEMVLGEALQQYPREQFILSTKVGRLLVPDSVPKVNNIFPDSRPYKDVFDYTYEGIRLSVKESLQRLRMQYLDIVHIHDLDTVTHGEHYPALLASFLQKNAQGKSGYDALVELRRAGIIKAIGIGSNEWQGCLAIIENTPADFLDCVMLAGRYTLFEQTSIEKFFPACIKRNIKVMIAGPLNSGLLGNNSVNTYYNYQPAPQDIIKKKHEIESVCEKHGASLRHAALQFLLLNPHVVTIVSGMRTPNEIKENMENLKKPVSSLLWHELKSRGLMEKEAFTNMPQVEQNIGKAMLFAQRALSHQDIERTESSVTIRSKL